MSKTEFRRFVAFLFLDNADKNKYGSLITQLSMQQSLGNNQYPKSVTEATNVLSNHRFDTIPSKINSKKKPTTDDTSSNKDKEESPSLSFAQLEGKCFCCGKPGHRSTTCKQKNTKPKSE